MVNNIRKVQTRKHGHLREYHYLIGCRDHLTGHISDRVRLRQPNWTFRCVLRGMASTFHTSNSLYHYYHNIRKHSDLGSHHQLQILTDDSEPLGHISRHLGSDRGRRCDALEFVKGADAGGDSGSPSLRYLGILRCSMLHREHPEPLRHRSGPVLVNQLSVQLQRQADP